MISDASSDPVRETVFEWFKDVVVEVWGKWPPSLTLHLSPEPPKASDVLASIGYARSATGMAVGRHLIRYPREATLHIADALLTRSPEDIHKILRHEAIHLGYPRHDADFRRVALEVGAVIAGAGLDTGGKIEVQKKIGARFKTQREFEVHEEREATAWAKEQMKLEPGTRWRIQFGGCSEGEGEGEELGDLDGRRKASAPARSLIERLELVTSGLGEESWRDYIRLAREVEPDVDENDEIAVKVALLAYLQNEYDLAREAREKESRR